MAQLKAISIVYGFRSIVHMRGLETGGDKDEDDDDDDGSGNGGEDGDSGWLQAHRSIKGGCFERVVR
ncbi:hypothetical protein RUM44_002139 [Polyplax serrata]|uniref:Uncharacterized protein n=1 Tax=Polyplax serrata TaxID=468196 RepID=A0ABR1AM13_POLSC